MPELSRRNLVLIVVAVALVAVVMTVVVIIRRRVTADDLIAPTTVEQSSTVGTVSHDKQDASSPKAADYRPDVVQAQLDRQATGLNLKTEDIVDPLLVGTVQTFTMEEKKAMNLPLDAVIHYKWVAPSTVSGFQAPTRVILDMPIQDTPLFDPKTAKK